MPSSVVRSFTDPDDYAAAQRGVKSELTVIGRGHFTANLIGIGLHRLGLQRSSDNLPRTAHSVNSKGLAIITFRTHPGPSLVRSGVEMEPTNIFRHGEDQAYYQRSSGSASFGALSLAVEDVAEIAEAMGGIDLTPPRDAMLVTPHRAQWQGFSGCTQRPGTWRKRLRKSSSIPTPHAGWSKRSSRR